VHHANHFYGHAHVLARYCGLTEDEPPRIHGYLQHGWNIGDGLAPGTPYVAGSPIYVWSERTRRRAWSVGRRNVIVTGSPFSYLTLLEPGLMLPEQEREGTIWYPFHGWEGQHVKGDHRELISLIKETEPGPVTVCLYWQEYNTRRVRRMYENAGFRIVCHGYRGHWWENTDKRFLYKQLAELGRHKRVASNRVSSALFYGILAGCDPAVYGDPMVLDKEDPTFGGFRRIMRQWPMLHGTHPDPVLAREVAAEEMGMGYLASPQELRELLGWSEAYDRNAATAADVTADIATPETATDPDDQTATAMAGKGRLP
jgi:hypothetical protein